MRAYYPRILLVFVVFLCFVLTANAQIECKASEANALFFKKHPEAHKEYLRTMKKGNFNVMMNQPTNGTYTIPVVFHVYGSNFNGYAVSERVINDALEDLNQDFQGLNDDFNGVDANFRGIRGTLNIVFSLAKKDPNGNSTSGIVWHGNDSGFGNSGGYDSAIAADAWDNYKYMNVYIQNDLYNDGSLDNSGIAWFPNVWMSDNNLARVVYNGRYLGPQNELGKEFASVLTHEFGHWLNLIHTFEGGCSGTDEVSDTPPENGQNSLGCSFGTNCNEQAVNYENYMGYNGAAGCYKMFTQGQVARMVDALSHPSRAPLWSEENLRATGLLDDVSDPLPNGPPMITISSPVDQVRIRQGEFLNLILEVSDPNGPNDIKAVKVTIADRELTLNAPPYQTNIEGLPLGVHTLNAVATDMEGASQNASITVNIIDRDTPLELPSINWQVSTYTYLVDGKEMEENRKVLQLTILDEKESHRIQILGPNQYSNEITTEVGRQITIENLRPGTWTIRIPSENTEVTKSF